ncbi:hypothetical protein [Bacillus sp. JJ722]|uniref:hypothetical protein n=1 Tax=Bacillus sp. JJ722 TaxID=3122973 RepID=UPI003F689FD8
MGTRVSDPLEVKIFELRLAGIPVKEVKVKLNIRNNTQTKTWMRWYQNGELHDVIGHEHISIYLWLKHYTSSLNQHTLNYTKERLCCLCLEDVISNHQAVIDAVDAVDANHLALKAVVDVVDVVDAVDVNHLALIDVDVVEEGTVISFAHFFKN